MCGIFGFTKEDGTDSAERALAGFSEIATRGPDGRGSFETPGLYLGHTRLSIQDLSQAGSQPMLSSSPNRPLDFQSDYREYLC